jgi:D-glycero-D-manno-heptose 1,7-bisphosphate phosphatase
MSFAQTAPTRGAVIFDRDGVLNVDVAYAHRPDQIQWVEGAMAAVRAVNAAGLFAFVATNQSGIARGLYRETDVVALHDWMNVELARFGARIDAFVYSPYHPDGVVEAYRRESPCRKPGPGMLLDLLARFPVDPARTLMIGDRSTDIEAAHAAGVEGLLFAGGSVFDAIAPWLKAQTVGAT